MSCSGQLKKGNISRFLIMTPFWKLCLDGNLDGVLEAVTRGENVNSCSGGDNRNFSLMLAVFNNHNLVVRFLLEQPSLDLNCTNVVGKTALHFAVLGDNVEGLQLLLADPRLNTVNHKDKDGVTPVMTAVISKRVGVLRKLVAHPSVNLDTRDDIGRSLEERARQR